MEALALIAAGEKREAISFLNKMEIASDKVMANLDDLANSAVSQSEK